MRHFQRFFCFGVLFLIPAVVASGQSYDASCAPPCDEFPTTSTWSTRIRLDTAPQASQDLVGSAELGMIFLGRSGFGGEDIVFDQDGNTLLNTSELKGDLGTGQLFKVAILNMSPTRPVDLQFETFSVNNIRGRKTVRADEVFPVLFNGIPVTPGEEETVEAVTDLKNYELNLGSRFCKNFRWFTGFRYLMADDGFNVFNNNGNVGFGTDSYARNELMGGQFGLAGNVWNNQYAALYGVAKVAFVENRITGHANAIDPGGSDLDVSYFAKNNSKLLDFELGFYSMITDRSGFRVGYRGIFAEDLAIAANQTNDFDIFEQTGSPEFSDINWQGFFLSLEAVW